MSRDLDGAIPHFRQTLQIEPVHGFAWLGLGWAYHELGRADEALWCLRKAVELERTADSGPTAGVAGYLAECLRVGGDLEGARRAALEGMASAERSDHMYRDTFRVVCLVSLGRTALRQRDLPAARTAFQQAVLHVRGRPHALGGGHLLVQALAGLAQAGGGAESYEEALAARQAGELNFSWFWICQGDLTALELSRAARAAGRMEDARRHLDVARAGGSRESRAEPEV